MIMSKEDKKEELFSEEYFDSLETTLKDKKDMRRFESEETVNATDREIEEYEEWKLKSKSKFLRWVMDYKWYDAQRVHTGLFNVFGMKKTNPTRHKRMFPLFISGIIFTRFIIFLSCGGLIIYGYCVFFCDI